MQKQILSVQLSEKLVEVVRSIAAREEISQSDVLRRLIRRGIESERRTAGEGSSTAEVAA